MAANAIDWPAAIRPWMVDFLPRNQSRSGGPGLAGDEQVTVSPAGRWDARVTLAIRGETANLALRAFVADMEGRAGTVLVPRWGRFRPRDVMGRQFSAVPTAGHGSCDNLNFDLSGMGQEERAYALTDASAALRGSRVAVNVLSGDGPRPGHDIGIGMRLYRVTRAWQVEEGDPLSLQVFPTLRSAVPEGARVILDRPVCLMRFASDSEGDDALSRAGSGRVAMNFEEVSPSAESVPVWTGDVA